VELARCWGVAENGDAIELAVRPHLVEELLRRWPPMGLTRSDTPVAPTLIQRGLSDEWIIIPDRDPSGDNPPPEAWDQLEQTVTLFAVRGLVRFVAVHAAVLESNGRAIVIPAASGGGKSTLSIAAHRAGLGVLSDEYALIDPSSGLVTGWPRPVRTLRADGTVDRHQIATASEPIPVGLLAFLTHQEQAGPGDAGGWSPLTPAQAVGELLSHTICARDRPHESFDAALAVARTARAVKGSRGEADDEVAALVALCG